MVAKKDGKQDEKMALELVARTVSMEWRTVGKTVACLVVGKETRTGFQMVAL